MPQVGVNQEALYEQAVYVYDGSLWRPLLADTAGRLLVVTPAGVPVEVTQTDQTKLLATVYVAASQTIQVTQATPASLQAAVNLNADQNVQARGYGYIAAAWQRQPLQFGYGDTVALTYTNTDLPAGLTTYNFAAVPANTVHVLTSMVMQYTGTVATVGLALALVIDGTAYYALAQQPPVSGSFYMGKGDMLLGPGDNLRLIVANATLHDDVVAYATGYSFALNL